MIMNSISETFYEYDNLLNRKYKSYFWLRDIEAW